MSRHLAVDAVHGFFASLHLGLQLRVRERLAHGDHHLAEHFAPVAARCQHRSVEHLVAQRIQVLEAQLFQFAKQGVQSQAMRDRRIDFQRFARDAAASLGVDRFKRAHVVQPIGELDQHDAHVARHRQQHLAEVFGLRLLGR